MHFQIRQCNKIGLTINTIHRFQMNKENFRFYIHVHKAVCDYLESEDITILPHPPNSPDLAPCDF